MPTISIIIPVYNVESYLRDCLNSIVHQHFKDFEVLLINDGSSDNSGKICDEYAANDERIRVFHKNNGGVSSARNLGLTEAKGEWICFVDSDDWIEPNTLSSITKIEDNEIDFVQFGFKQINATGKIMMQSDIPSNRITMGKDAYLNTNTYHSAICGYLIKTNTIRKYNINFPETIKYGEDQAFILKALMCSHKIHIINGHFYNYRYWEGSTMNSSMTFARAEDHLKVIQDITSFMNSTNANISFLLSYIFNGFILTYIRIGLNTTKNLRQVKERYSLFCKSLNNVDIYNFCKKYDSYYIIIFYYIRLRLINPIISRIKKYLVKDGCHL